MLAYVFWHWHGPQIEAGAYQHHLIAFHQALSAHKPRGFDSSMVLLAEQAPWLGRDAPTYEDWYLVENSAALDPLNEDAVSGPCQGPHNQVARWTEGGTGGLCRLHSGRTDSPVVRFAWRFNKPAGMSYAALYELLRPSTDEGGVNLWVRQMTLGPGPEFCLHSRARLILPHGLHALEIPVRQLWWSGERAGG